MHRDPLRSCPVRLALAALATRAPWTLPCAALAHPCPPSLKPRKRLCANARTRVFGTQAVPPKAILKELPTLFGHADPLVRAEVGPCLVCAHTRPRFDTCAAGVRRWQATKLTVELHRWIGGAITNFLNGLKPVQVRGQRPSGAGAQECSQLQCCAPPTEHTQMKELEDLFQAQPAERPRQTRFTRAQQRAMNAGQVVAGTLAAQPAAARVCAKHNSHWRFVFFPCRPCHRQCRRRGPGEWGGGRCGRCRARV